MAVSVLFPMIADASDIWADSRLRVFIEAERELGEDYALHATLIPSSNLARGVIPLGFLRLDGLRVGEDNFFEVMPRLGWHFGEDTPITSVGFRGGLDDWRVFSVFDWRPDTSGTFWFANLTYKIADGLAIGAEEESFGRFDQDVSHGAGPDIILNLGPNRLDFSLHIRSFEEGVQLEPFFRWHINL